MGSKDNKLPPLHGGYRPKSTAAKVRKEPLPIPPKGNGGGSPKPR